MAHGETDTKKRDQYLCIKKLYTLIIIIVLNNIKARKISYGWEKWQKKTKV